MAIAISFPLLFTIAFKSNKEKKTLCEADTKSKAIRLRATTIASKSLRTIIVWKELEKSPISLSYIGKNNDLIIYYKLFHILSAPILFSLTL